MIDRTYEKPAQEKLRSSIFSLQAELDVVQRAKDANLSCVADPTSTIKRLRNELECKKKNG